MSSIGMPAFAVYVIPDGQVPQSRVLTAEETQQLQQRLLEGGVQPVAVVVPNLDPPDNTRPLIAATLSRDSVTYTPANAPGVQQSTTITLTTDQPLVGMVVTNQTFTYNGSASRALTLSGGANFNANAGTLNVSNNISGTMVIMPANQGATIQLQSGGSPP